MRRTATWLIVMTIICLAQINVQAQTIYLQFIHNTPDTALSPLDLYINDTLVKSPFKFREATAFMSITSTTARLVVDIRKNGADKASVPVLSDTIFYTHNDTSIAFIQGLVYTAPYPVNPEGIAIKAGLVVKKQVSLGSGNSNNFRFFFHNGVVDAPETVVSWRKSTPILLDQNFNYGDTSGTYIVPVENIPIDFQEKAGSKIYESFLANFNSLGDSSCALFYSGFLNYGIFSNHKAALFMATSDGRVLPVTRLISALIQIIHNAADTSIKSIDVYANTTKLVDNLDFRHATAYLLVPANDSVTITVTEASKGFPDNFFQTKIYPVAAVRYTLVTKGLVYPAQHQPNPEGVSTVFGLSLFQGKQTSSTAGKFETKVFHGVSDLKSIDLSIEGEGDIFTNGGYTQINTSYQPLPPAEKIYVVKDSTATSTLYKFRHDLSGQQDSAGLTLLSGFVNATYGPAVSLITVLPSGNVIVSTEVTGIELNETQHFSIFPNPFQNRFFIKLNEDDLPKSVHIYDMNGRTVSFHLIRQEQGGVNELNMPNEPQGIYFLRITTRESSYTQKIYKY